MILPHPPRQRGLGGFGWGGVSLEIAMTTKDTRSAEDLFRDAIDLARSAYCKHYREIGDEIIQMGRDGEWGYDDDAREKLSEYMHETIDSDGWVIYTQKAQMVCCLSENDGAYIDNFGTDGIVDDGAINWSRLAFAALEADVYAYLDAHGFDVNDPSSWKPGDEE